MTITLQILCDGIPCGNPLSESAARAWLEFVQHVAPDTAKAMVTAMLPTVSVSSVWPGCPTCTCGQTPATHCNVHGQFTVSWAGEPTAYRMVP